MRVGFRCLFASCIALVGLAVDIGAAGAAASPQLRGSTERASVTSAGGQANAASSGPTAVSGDGAIIAFSSAATDLVRDGVAGLYVRDRVRLLTQFIAPDGRSPSLSYQGRFVAFTSSAPNIVTGVTGTQVYVRDRRTGATVLASVAPDGSPGNAASDHASISADGHLVAFASKATNLDPGHARQQVVFVRDLTSQSTSTVAPGASPDTWMEEPAISGDGTTLVYTSHSQPERCLGYEASAIQVTRVGQATSRTVGCGSGPSLSSDGLTVGFLPPWRLPDGPQAGCVAGFVVVNRRTGQQQTVGSAGAGQGVLSADGHHVLTLDCPNPGIGLLSGPNPSFPLLTVPGTGSGETISETYLDYQGTSATGQGNWVATFGSSSTGYGLLNLAVSADGRVASYESDADTLVTGDTNQAPDIFANVAGILDPQPQ